MCLQYVLAAGRGRARRRSQRQRMSALKELLLKRRSVGCTKAACRKRGTELTQKQVAGDKKYEGGKKTWWHKVLFYW